MAVAAILMVFGVFVLYRGVRSALSLRALRREGSHVTGTVTGHQRRGSGARSAIVTYVDEHGADRQITSPLSSSWPIGAGKAVTVRYRPGDPDSSRIDDRMENLGHLVLTAAVGIGFPVAGAVLAVKGHW
ncbi:DUF3592 domain-containing protein [Actinoplanes palleronii]|uniref:DUF3592 domain-containing protein n=1 Tax=Actinoplanes palleronii TaxID=113570 RepID=A0ABQ4BSW0_9ACTN|nr:DUF3592 domain-containing protein [Actinoplanes palleronii]GIE73783.1 hypothetical protein Apa02nite_098910 [Actinoplanes palleronii]